MGAFFRSREPRSEAGPRRRGKPQWALVRRAGERGLHRAAEPGPRRLYAPLPSADAAVLAALTCVSGANRSQAARAVPVTHATGTARH